MFINSFMKKPIVIDKDISLEEVARILSEHNISSLIFVKNDKVSGIITKGDIVKNFGKKKRMSEVMAKKVITVNSEEKVNNAIDIMDENGISVLPIVDKKNGLVGVVSAKDLLYQACHADEFLLG